MNGETLSSPFSDEVLVAYLDNRLSEKQRAQFDQQLARDDVLGERLAQMARSIA